LQAIAQAHRRQFSGSVVGITGSCGKTSTKDLLSSLLKNAHRTHKNLNNTLGVPLALSQIDFKKHSFAVIEAGISAVGEMSEMAPLIAPDIALVTNIAETHSAPMGGIENIAREKAVLGHYVRSGGKIILTAETLQHEPFAKCAQNRSTWALCKDAQIELPARVNRVIYEIQSKPDGLELELKIKEAVYRFDLPLVSSGQATNAALALTCALLLNESANVLAERLMLWKPSEHRGELFVDDRIWYSDCYNASPLSMADALDFFGKIIPLDRPRVYVLGSMEELGEDAVHLHHKIASRIALRPQDSAFLIGTHARDYLAALAGSQRAKCFETTAEALHQIASISEGSAVFLKGSKLWRLWELIPQRADKVERNLIASCLKNLKI
jgi:UDP-N-acetylmuramoyl-tripeptide--D-alanyl-D-alanine ligase